MAETGLSGYGTPHSLVQIEAHVHTEGRRTGTSHTLVCTKHCATLLWAETAERFDQLNPADRLRHDACAACILVLAPAMHTHQARNAAPHQALDNLLWSHARKAGIQHSSRERLLLYRIKRPVDGCGANYVGASASQERFEAVAWKWVLREH
jgi:hypothetical protein